MEKIELRKSELTTFDIQSTVLYDSQKNDITNFQCEEKENLDNPTKEKLKSLIQNKSSKQDSTSLIHQSTKLTSEQGRLGIKNLGNTCYMNSALQCLGHTRELMNYFLSGEYKKDHTKQDEKDADSELLYYFTNYFSEFILELWSDTREAINPNNLRNILIKIYPQFDNNFQQDSHEVLTLILDSLHQQLNRVQNEYDMITSDMNLFSQLSQNSMSLTKHQSQYFWNSHKILNDSIITDLFFGQLISTIKCFNCYENYNTFEPFSSLGLSIPNEYKILLYFVPMKKNNKTIKIFLKINDNMQFKNLFEKVSDSTEYKFTNGIFYWVLNNKFIKLVDPDERCGDLLNRIGFLFLIETDYENASESEVQKNSQKLNEISHNADDLIFINSYFNDFYVCLNFNMFELPIGEKRKEVKISSYPRIFKYDNATILNLKDNSDIENEQFDEKEKIMKIFDPLISYIRNFIQAGVDFKELLENEFVFFTVKSAKVFRHMIDPIQTSETNFLLQDSKESNYFCLFCGRESLSEFLCDCINKWLFNQIFNFEEVNASISNLTCFLNNLTENQNNLEEIIEMNINISVEILKYRELNQCKDYTQKFIHENGINFYNLLDYFTGDEKLTLSDNYFCPTCKKNVIAYKKMQINKAPQVLVVNLKRFRYENNNQGKSRVSRRNDNVLMNNNNFTGEKKENMIDFPINNLDLTKYNKNNTSVFYELFAICNHQGKISSGHYTAICKHPTSYKWIEYDDKIVKNYSEMNLITPNAYLLFYRKKINS